MSLVPFRCFVGRDLQLMVPLSLCLYEELVLIESHGSAL
jgi:hypothetical protein